jgi:hypothetical protein
MGVLDQTKKLESLRYYSEKNGGTTLLQHIVNNCMTDVFMNES